MARQSNRDVIQTYRYLRGAMVALLLLLLFSVGYQWWSETAQSCWLGSISAYYYTPVRTVFVGSLFGLGAALIAYQGHSAEEDVLLNFSGFMAFVVAMVPTVPDGSCATNGFTQTPAEIAIAVRNNVWSLFFVAVVAVVTVLTIKTIKNKGQAKPAVRPGKPAICIAVSCTVVLLAELALFVALPERFIALSHGIAASTMITGVIIVMVLSALNVRTRHQGNTAQVSLYRNIYVVLAALLGLLLALSVGVSLAVSKFDHLILIAEVIIIVLFGTYWVVQTYELRNLFEPHRQANRAADDATAPAESAAEDLDEVAAADVAEARKLEQVAQ